MERAVPFTFGAWQPLTPRGVAAFALAPVRRLALVGLVVAGLNATTVVWFLHTVWVPTVREAIRQLPAQSELRQGKLVWPADSPMPLAGDRFLSIAVDLNHEAELGREADLAVELGQRDCRFFSLFGFVQVSYPEHWVVALNKAEAEPWWGAREPFILAGAAAVVVAGLWIAWATAATIFCPVPMVVAFFTDRALSWGGSWRLSVAAGMPGTLLLTAGVLCYGLGMVDLLRLGVIGLMQVVLGWWYLIVSPLFLPRLSSRRTDNPFAVAKQTSPNPFTGSRADTDQ